MAQLRPPIIELRQYVIAAGRRARMIELFDTHFVTAQDALELPILGHFVVPGDADRLVWIRGFDHMDSRPQRLGAFYGGPVWAEFGAEAIGLVAGYDNVQLLREAAPGAGIAADPDQRPHADAPPSGRLVFATTYRLKAPADTEFIRKLRAELDTLHTATVLGMYVTDPTPNNFPPLPIREGEHLVTWFAAGPSGEPVAIDESALEGDFIAPPERLSLEPAPRSLLR